MKPLSPARVPALRAATPAPAPVASAPPMQRFSEALEKAWFRAGKVAEKAFFYGA